MGAKGDALTGVASYIKPNELLIKKSKPLVDTLKELFPLRVVSTVEQLAHCPHDNGNALQVPKKGKRAAVDVFGSGDPAAKASNADPAAAAASSQFNLVRVGTGAQGSGLTPLACRATSWETR